MGERILFSLEGQVGVMTGVAQGIGKGIAERLHAAGVRVAVVDLNKDTAEKSALPISGFGLACDVASAMSVENAVREIRRRLGPIDILVNNAGITGRTMPLLELEEGDLDQVYAVNLKRVF